MYFFWSLIIHLLVIRIFCHLPNVTSDQVRQNSILWLQVKPGSSDTLHHKSLDRRKSISHLKQNGGKATDAPSPSDLGTLASSSRKAESSYIALVRNKIGSSITYPLTLRRRKIFGEVKVQLILNPSGDIESSLISKSSGYKELDSLALEAIAAAAPFPAFDSELKKLGKLHMNLPIHFKLSLN